MYCLLFHGVPFFFKLYFPLRNEKLQSKPNKQNSNSQASLKLNRISIKLKLIGKGGKNSIYFPQQSDFQKPCLPRTVACFSTGHPVPACLL